MFFCNLADRVCRCPAVVRLALAALFSTMGMQSARAGGGAENVFLVINASSESSRMIANHYIQLRNIPPGNVISLNWTGSKETVSSVHFRDRILTPVLKALDDRQLSMQIDYVVYSSDFPWRIHMQGDFPDEKFPKAYAPVASINGATYLWSYVLQKNRAIVMPNVNWFAPQIGQNQVSCTQLADAPSQGFRGRFFWLEGGKRSPDPMKGQRYLLSTMLGVTSGRGNRVDEVLNYLRRSVGVDGQRPHGTFYFMRNKDIRSRTRHECYTAAVAQLETLGARAEIKEGILPNGSRDVMGLMTGASNLEVGTSNMQLIPGAICDNLTSYGGDLRAGTSQTPLTDFLRLGAAGASGTVFEPTAQQAKFPLASVQVHYRRGCSMAEAFYQSVNRPYQLLIVGDALCQPWATPPKVEVSVAPDQKVSGELEVIPKITPAPGKAVGLCEFYLDGKLLAGLPAGRSMKIDTTQYPDGSHELRIVASNGDRIESQGRAIVPIMISNHGHSVELAISPSTRVTRLDVLKVEAKSAGAAAVRILAHDREVGRIEGDSGTTSVSAGEVGPGPISLRAEGIDSEGNVMSLSTKVSLQIE